MQRAWLVVLVCFVVACVSNTRVGRGQLYTPGETKYDAYFKQIHDLQVSVAAWPEDRRAARKPLIGALQIAPDASDGTLARTTQDRAKAGAGAKLELNGETAQARVVGGREDPVLKAVEETARAEIDRVRRLRALEPKLEELGKQAQALEDAVDESFRDTEKQHDVHGELSDCHDVLRQLAVAAKRQARDGEDFLADLQRAVGGEATLQHGDTRGFDKPSDRQAAASTPPPSVSPPTPTPAPAPAPKPASTIIDLDQVPTPASGSATQPQPPLPPPPAPPPPTASTTATTPTPTPAPTTKKKPGGKPKPKPKPKPAGGGEVFNP